MSITHPLPAYVDLTELARTLARWQVRWTQDWHQQADSPRASSALAVVIQENHRRNYDLWHEEDQARAPDATDQRIAEVKRRIDKLNQQRNDLIEQIDDYLFRMAVQRDVQTPKDAPWNTETPGSTIDRLSINALKIYHMREQEERQDATAEHRRGCGVKREVLERQREDLVIALQLLLDDIYAGRKQVKLYRQFKMYNDPALNPAIYGAREKGA